VATVTISGASYGFGCDRDSRENILGINTAIASGLPIPNPRPWMPKGAVTPVMCTHADLAAIGGALLARKDAVMQAYFAHKAAIKAMADVDAILSHDVTAGWPA
jgi:hypothetical protein